MFARISQWPERRAGMGLVLCISLALKTAILIALSGTAINVDGSQYIAAGRHFMAGEFALGMQYHPLPLYPILLAATHVLIPDWLLAGRILSAGALVLTLIPLYLTARDLFGPRSAFWATLALALAPEPNSWSVDLLRGPVFVLIFTWSVYFAQRAVRIPTARDFLLSAVLCWVAVLFRIEGLILPPALICYLALAAVKYPLERKKYAIGALIWIAVPAGILLILTTGLIPGGFKINRIGKVLETFRNISSAGFLANYHRIYQQLSDLEATALYPTGGQNFAEIARHYMPLIYCFGLLENFIKVLFPLYVIPLLWGIRRSLSRSGGFILFLTGCYLLMLYYALLEKDFTQYRFVYAPVVCVYPWIGLGIGRILDRLRKYAWPRSLQAALILFIGAVPLFMLAAWISGEETVHRRAGEWLARRPELVELGLVCNDSRVVYHAGLDRTYYETHKRAWKASGKSVDQYALDAGLGLIVWEHNKSDNRISQQMRHFRPLKQFNGKKNDVTIFRRP